jgi:hypothetical protein
MVRVTSIALSAVPRIGSSSPESAKNRLEVAGGFDIDSAQEFPHRKAQ